jgi:hypothetical protein
LEIHAYSARNRFSRDRRHPLALELFQRARRKSLPQTTAWPVASNDVVSTVLGAPAQLIDPDFGVRVNGLRPLVADDLDYVPVQGVGNAVYWATVRDRSLAPERMGVLISQQGTDALAIGVMDTPEALGIAATLTQAVVAAQVP